MAGLFGAAAALAPKRANVRGILWIACAAPCVVGMNSAVRLIGDLPAIEIAFFRYAIGFAVLMPWLLSLKWHQVRSHQHGLHVLRAVIQLVALMSLIYGLRRIPLADTTAFNFSQPLFVTIGAILVFGESSRLWRWGGIAVGFLGVVLIARPGFEAFDFGMLYVLAAAALFAVTKLIVRVLGRTDSSVTIVAYFSLLLTLMSLAPTLVVWQTPTLAQWMWLAVLGGLGSVSHLAMTQAVRIADEVSALMPIEYTQLLWATLVAYIAFAETPDPWTWVGGAMIVAGGTYLASREARAPTTHAP